MNYKIKRLLVILRRFLVDRFDLHANDALKLQTIEQIRKGVEFKGTNLWVLIFAIFIASLGLNTNSTAVIIGAMLISPLMGPIMGIGLGVGIQDFNLIKRSFKNLAIATIISIITSSIYFYISPLSEASSELLARTYPTTYDVLIALFGGMAGIVAVASRDRGNVVPGVAIATALMPPLCTAGYALATWQLNYFLGAFYLYFINSVFISFATYIGCRIFKLSTVHNQSDGVKSEKVKRYVMLVVIVTLIPSIYMAYNIIRTSIFENSAKKFIQKELTFDNTQIINTDINFSERKIEVLLIGEPVKSEDLAVAKDKMINYDLQETTLILRQGNNRDSLDLGSIKALVMEDFYKNSEQRLQAKDKKIDELQLQLQNYEKINHLNMKINDEVEVIFPNIEKMILSYGLQYNDSTKSYDTTLVAAVEAKKHIRDKEKEKMLDWLKARTQKNKVAIYSK
ncbi:MAG: DUF389 domain-containing protein [Ignavibacteria bacterium]|jgi:uncharacterized hydrophobic protein (TIGR00271 family)|nr:DUF389 domain-containing protein [Ignavibacteria bacterium]